MTKMYKKIWAHPQYPDGEFETEEETSSKYDPDNDPEIKDLEVDIRVAERKISLKRQISKTRKRLESQKEEHHKQLLKIKQSKEELKDLINSLEDVYSYSLGEDLG